MKWLEWIGSDPVDGLSTLSGMGWGYWRWLYEYDQKPLSQGPETLEPMVRVDSFLLNGVFPNKYSKCSQKNFPNKYSKIYICVCSLKGILKLIIIQERNVFSTSITNKHVLWCTEKEQVRDHAKRERTCCYLRGDFDHCLLIIDRTEIWK